MRRLVITLSIMAFILVPVLPAFSADNFPAQPAGAASAKKPQAAKDQPQLHYGYVPPPPIQHTWPGGYRVIFLEMMNSFMDHITGHY